MIVIKNYKAFTHNRRERGEVTLVLQKPIYNRQHGQKIINVRYLKIIQYSVAEALQFNCFGS